MKSVYKIISLREYNKIWTSLKNVANVYEQKFHFSMDFKSESINLLNTWHFSRLTYT
jgi:hypothetical protein